MCAHEHAQWLRHFLPGEAGCDGLALLGEGGRLGRVTSVAPPLESGLGPTSGPEVAPGSPKTELLGLTNIALYWHYW